MNNTIPDYCEAFIVNSKGEIVGCPAIHGLKVNGELRRLCPVHYHKGSNGP